MSTTRTKTIEETVALCDRCHREMPCDSRDCEYPERLAIRFRGGYGCIFGDGNLVEADIYEH